MVKIYYVAILLVLIFIYHSREEMPHVYFFGDPNDVLITVLAGTHGNERAPSLFLDCIENHPKPDWLQLAVVPIVNRRAFAEHTRYTVNQRDINRTWPDGEINRYLRPLVDRSALVIDFHEAWGFNKCNGASLGQTVYTNDTRLRPVLDATIARLNRHARGCLAWQRIDSLPAARGTLDDYCTRNDISYILVELAGQRDVVPLDVRFQEMRIIMSSLLSTGNAFSFLTKEKCK